MPPANGPDQRAVDTFHPNATTSDLPLTDGAAAHHKDSQLLGRLTGIFFLITYATSIPPVLTLYVPALSDPAFVLGGPSVAPEFFWELLLGIWLLVRGFNPAALAGLDARQS